jgi:hypothetical protein
MKLFKIFFLFINSFLIVSCSQESIEQSETKTTIVEGYLSAGNPVDSIRVTQSYSYGQVEEEIITIDDLNIRITNGNNEFELTSIGNGYYQNTNLIIDAGKNYQLEFERGGEIISAETYVPEHNVASISTTEVELKKIEAGVFPTGGIIIPDPVEVSWNNNDGDYYYVLIKNIETDPEYVNENIAQFEGQLQFITEPQISNFYAIRTQRELLQFGTYEIIVFRVNPEYAALYESSGSSTLSLEEPPSNIVNGLGIFTGVSSDTIYLEVTKL